MSESDNKLEMTVRDIRKAKSETEAKEILAEAMKMLNDGKVSIGDFTLTIEQDGTVNYLVKQGLKVKPIKYFREFTGAGLKEAADAVSDYYPMSKRS